MNYENLRDFLDLIPDAVILVSEDGSIVLANQQAGRLLGYASHELIGARLEMLVPQRFRERHAFHFSEYLRNPKHRPMGDSQSDLYALHKQGNEFPVDITLSSIQTENRRLIFAGIRDISERTQCKLELMAALAELDNLKNRLLAENAYLQEEIREAGGFDEIIGHSRAIKNTLHRIAQVAPTDANVLITGETGTGKELVARSIHSRSRRKDHPLVKLNCAALPAGLIESEMFGHEKGAFTGALFRSIGRFELADHGTIFLDEIGELEPGVQVKLLRVLQERELQRLGSSTTFRVDLRVIAATNRDVLKAMREGRFRSDLYYRLAVFPIDVPPLRDRREDIPLLVQHFVAKNQAKLGKQIDRIPVDVMNALTAYDWPGNVRELENLIERAMILSPSTTLSVSEFPEAFADEGVADLASGKLEAIERVHILKTLRECGWKIKGKDNAANRLGLKPSTLYARMRKLGIERPP